MKSTGTYLDRILADTAAELAARHDLPDAPPPQVQAARGFAKVLAKPAISLIAEIKKASPSRGVIRKDFYPAAIAQAYQAGGAAALSVLTDAKYFQGSINYLDEVRAAATLPMLRKDFIIHPAQIFETVGRADAILLIVAALEKAQLGELLSLATACGLDTLMEVHDRQELDIALELSAPVIGINNRDLRSFTIDLQTTYALLPFIPDDRIIVSESGISTAAQLRKLANAGVRAVLVGESLMKSADIAAKTRELLA